MAILSTAAIAISLPMVANAWRTGLNVRDAVYSIVPIINWIRKDEEPIELTKDNFDSIKAYLRRPIMVYPILQILSNKLNKLQEQFGECSHFCENCDVILKKIKSLQCYLIYLHFSDTTITYKRYANLFMDIYETCDRYVYNFNSFENFKIDISSAELTVLNSRLDLWVRRIRLCVANSGHTGPDSGETNEVFDEKHPDHSEDDGVKLTMHSKNFETAINGSLERLEYQYLERCDF